LWPYTWEQCNDPKIIMRFVNKNKILSTVAYELFVLHDAASTLCAVTLVTYISLFTATDGT